MTVDGGVLLYGLGGDDPTCPDRREPFDLTGAAERIDRVAQTGIAEPPVIEIHDIASDAQPGTGYLSVVIPAAPRAPHMLTINGTIATGGAARRAAAFSVKVKWRGYTLGASSGRKTGTSF